MKLVPVLLGVALSVAATAQTQTLTVNPNGVLLTYSNPGANFFDLVVTPPLITLRALQIPVQEPIGTTGTIELWINTINATHVGNEQLAAPPTVSGDPSGWQLMTSGDYTSGGFDVLAPTCQSAFTINVPNTELAAGTYAFAVVHVGVNHEFDAALVYPAPAGTFSDANIEVTNGTTQATSWISAPLNAFVFGGVNYQGTIPNFAIEYDVGSVPHACATTSSFGQGSIQSTASFFDRIQTAPIVSTTLQGTSLELTYTPTGYVVAPGTATYVPPSASANAIAPVDDGESQITLPNLTVVFPTDDGVPTPQSDLYVHSNGYISTAPQSGLFFAPVDPQSAMDADALSWYLAYHDFNPAEIGSGTITWEEDLAATPNPMLYITWANVESYPAGVANQSTVQFQMDLTTYTVNYVYETFDAVGGSTQAGGDDTIVGWSPAGASPDPSEFDYSALTPFVVNLPEVFGLQLDVSGLALVGQSADLETSNVITGNLGLLLLNSNLVGGAPLPLQAFGADAQTVAWLDPTTSATLTIDDGLLGGSLIVTVPIPNNPTLAGVEIFGQSFWLDFNDLLAGDLFTKMLSSNGVSFTIGI